MNVLEVYYVYSMKVKVAHHFYYKSSVLFNFLKTYEKNSNQIELKDQFSYIIDEFDQPKLMYYIKSISNYIQITQIQPGYFQISDGTKSVYLHVLDTHFVLKCPSIHVAEELLFESLRLFPSHLFVVHAEKHVYGWISTLKNKESINNRQLL